MPPITSDQFAKVLLDALGLPDAALNYVGTVKIELLPGQTPVVTMRWFVHNEPSAEALKAACMDARIVVEPVDFRSIGATKPPKEAI